MGGGSEAIFLILLGPILMLTRSSRVIHTLLALEFMSLATLVYIFSSQQILAIGISGVLMTLSCLVLEASVGIGLLVSLLRWGGKLGHMNS